MEKLLLLRILYGKFPSFLENSQKDSPETTSSEIYVNHSLYCELYDFVILALMKQLYTWNNICSVLLLRGRESLVKDQHPELPAISSLP